MALTENGKKYIATTFGNSSKCYVGTGLSWSYLGTDNQTYNESGGTAQIVSRLIMASLVQSITFNGQTFTYTALKTANDNTDLALSDAQWIAQNDGTPAGETQYCQTAGTTGSISCTTTPAGASISLDGVNQSSITPVTLTNVSAGSHTVTFTLSGYGACPQSVTVTAGATATASCIMTPATTNTGSISCTTTPLGASISLDGVNLTTVTPTIITNITPGLHTLVFTLPGYNSCSGQITVIAGYIITASCLMTPLDDTGSIICTTTPPGAPITLDGMNMGMVTPATLLNVPGGLHNVMFSLSGYNTCTKFVNVPAGASISANCILLLDMNCNTPCCKIDMR